MGAIWCRKKELISSTGEIVGYKSGLALSLEQLKHFSSNEYESFFSDDQESCIRIRAEEYEQFLAHILYEIGVISTESICSFVVGLFHRYKDDEKEFMTFLDQILVLYTCFEKDISLFANGSFIHFSSIFEDKSSFDIVLHIATSMNILIQKSVIANEFNFRKQLFIHAANQRKQYKNDEILESILIGLTDLVQRSPWISYQSIQWRDERELNDLFTSEQLHSCHGDYFDQRFINYLSTQYNDISKIHWRQFEGLAAEFLQRENYIIEIGKGRNDDNIDIRAWKNKQTADAPPTLLVQCKRQKDKVGKVIVKALWADIEYEKAQSGLIVTSSALEPGAKKTLIARSYPIIEIDRDSLRKWIMAMRTPWTGIIMSE